MRADEFQLREIAGDAIEINRPRMFARHGFEHVADLDGNRDLELIAFGVERIHFGVMQRNIETVNMHVDPFETVFLDRAVNFLQRLLDAERIVTGKADEAAWIAARVLRHFVKPGVHVHPFIPVRPHLALGDENFFYIRFIHFRHHGVDALELRQAADRPLHPANELAFFRLVPAPDKFRRGDVIHEVDGLDVAAHDGLHLVFILPSPSPLSEGEG